jgi:hypothetical protein
MTNRELLQMVAELQLLGIKYPHLRVACFEVSEAIVQEILKKEQQLGQR